MSRSKFRRLMDRMRARDNEAIAAITDESDRREMKRLLRILRRQAIEIADLKLDIFRAAKRRGKAD